MSKLFFVIMVICGLAFAAVLGTYFAGDTSGVNLMRALFAFMASVILWKLVSK